MRWLAVLFGISFVLWAANGFELPADPAGNESDYSGRSFDCGPYGNDQVEQADKRATAAKRRADRTEDPADIERFNELADEYNRLLKQNCE